MQTIANHVVILGVPDYGTPPEYGYSYGTDVTSGELGTGYGETRNIRRTGKRRTQAWTIKTSTGYETFAIEESIRSSLESKKAAVPWLPHVRQVRSVIGDVLELDSIPFGMSTGTRLWYVDLDTRSGGYLIADGWEGPPEITVQPVGSTLFAGDTLTLSVTAEESTVESTTRFIRVTDATGVTARCIIAPLMFGLLTSANAGQRTVVGNTYDLEFRESASGGAAPAIVSGLTFSGWDADSPRLFAFVTGREPMTYAWTRDGEPVPGNTSELILTPGDVNGTYKLVASNDFGSAETDEYAFAGYPPTITTQPVSRYIAPGASTSITCVATTDEERDGPVTYASYTAAGALMGTSGTLTFTAMPEDYSEQFYFVATNGIGSATSNTVTVATGYPPTITTQPVGATLWGGETLTLTVTATE